MSPDVISPINEKILSGFITQGPAVEEFEQKLQQKFNYPYILTLNSATSGLTLAIRMIKDKMQLSNDDEVLSCPLTCMATNLPIVANDLRIKWVDVDPTTGLIDLDDLENKLTEKTKIITFVHWGGYPVDMQKLTEILDRNEERLGFRPYVVEDCAHAFLSEYGGGYVGSSGNFGVFSLQAIKHLTTGDGGLIFCPNEEFYEKAKLLRWYGIDRDKRNYNRKDLRLEHDVEDWGYKYHMNDINATLGIYNLPHISNLIEKNRRNAQIFDKELEGVSILNRYDENRKSAYWLYTILVDNKEKFIEFMKENGVFCSQVHQRNDIHTCFKEFKVDLPNLDEFEKKMVCIPVGWWLEEKDVKEIISLIKMFNNI
jgi:dTDP-4-amino-4,6-dideoxygalactose transaminase